MIKLPPHPNQRGRAPSAIDQQLQRAVADLESGFPQGAERIATDVLKTSHHNPVALKILGCAMLLQGRAQEAIEPLERSARAAHDAATDMHLATALRQVGRKNDALARLQRAVKRKPPFVPAFQELALLLLTLQRYAEAIGVLNDAMKIDASVPELPIQLGNVHLARHQLEPAEAAFAGALALAPDHPEAHFGQGIVALEDSRFAVAAEHFRRFLQTRPDDATGWLNLGHALLGLGQTEEGHDCFRRAARGEPKRYGQALATLVKSGRGRLWLKPSAAAKFFQGEPR